MEPNEQDDNKLADSSVASDDKGADSSQQQPAAQQPQVVGDDVLEDQVNDPDGPEVTGDEAVQPNVQQQGQQAQGDDALPFHNHPRWKEVISERDRFKTEAEGFRTEAEQNRQLQSLLRTNQISPDEYQNALKYLIALRTDPVAAFNMLKPTYEQLAMLNGEILPPDLQAEVAAGTLTQERAAEISRGRGQQRWQGWRGQQQGQQQQQGLQEMVNQVTTMWEQSTVTTDPDFRPGTALYKQTNLYLGQMKCGSVEQARKNCEEAYKQAKQDLVSFAPKPIRSQRPPQSRPLPQGGGQTVKTAEDVINAVKAGIRPAQMRY